MSPARHKATGIREAIECQGEGMRSIKLKALPRKAVGRTIEDL